MIYKFRVILDHNKKGDIFRDIEIKDEATFENFHETIKKSFGLYRNEMASFYISNQEWEQGEEIALIDVSQLNNVMIMNQTKLKTLLNKTTDKLIYVYDFLNLWTFLIELKEIYSENKGSIYPKIIFEFGEIPKNAPEKNFESDNIEKSNNFEEDLENNQDDSWYLN
tara:strand:- start:110 stop:610 length:501 start_codon:yes stop_codon:yes gene_type:complete